MDKILNVEYLQMTRVDFNLFIHKIVAGPIRASVSEVRMAPGRG